MKGEMPCQGIEPLEKKGDKKMKICPECETQLIRESGCIYCPHCGYSICLCSVCMGEDFESNYLMDDEELIADQKLLSGRRLDV